MRRLAIACASRGARMPLAAAVSVSTMRQIQCFSSSPLLRCARKDESLDAGGSHPDFQPKVVATDESKEEIDAIKADIKETVESDEVVLFMKGVPEAPVCGFSKRLVDVLEELGLEYTSFDCLAHPIIRTYVKELSDWPTIPQLFVKGQFVGGIDICVEMAEKGELQRLLKSHKIAYRE